MPFQIGDYHIYTNEVHNEMVKLVDTDIIKYSITLLRVNTMIVNKEFLKSNNVPDIGSITISSEDYINESNNLTQEKIENITN